MSRDVKWIKIVTDIFDDEKIYAIETLPDGIIIEVVWFKILCLAGKCNQSGFLCINNKLAYTDEMLAKIFRLDIGIIQRALDVFTKLDMIEVVDNSYMVLNWSKYQNNDRLEEIREKNRERQQRFRNNQKNALIEERNVTRNVTNNVNCSISNIYNNSLSSFNNNTYIDIYKDIINYLNNKIDSNYKYTTQKTQKVIHARLEEGFTPEDFMKVIDNKVMEWKDNPSMAQYLRPETLFGGKFEGYLNQKNIKPYKSKNLSFEEQYAAEFGPIDNNKDWDNV